VTQDFVPTNLDVPPIAVFSLEASDVTIDPDGPLPAGDGYLVADDWSYGDQATASGDNAIHTCSTGGTFTNTLVVTDEDGNTESHSKPVLIPALLPAAVLFACATPGLTLACDASGSSVPNGMIPSCEWD